MGIYSGLGLPSKIRKEFFKRLNIAEAGTWANQLAMQFSSDSASETYKWLGGAPVMRVWKGGRLEKQLHTNSYTLFNELYEATLGVDLMDVRRDKYNQIMLRVKELATRTATHWESLLSALIVAGEDTACYDGQFFFDTDHQEGDSPTQTNDLTASEVPAANVVDPAAPTGAEFANIILETIQHLFTLQDNVGEPINQNAHSFVAYVPTSYMKAGMLAVNEKFLAAAESNPLLATPFNVSILPDPRLSWGNQLALFRTDGDMKPLIMQTEMPVESSMIGAGSEQEHNTNSWSFGVKASRTVGYGLWQHAALVKLS